MASCTSVFLAGKFLFVPSDTFPVVLLCRLATKRTEKKRIEENANVHEFLRQTIRRALVLLHSVRAYSLTS